VKDIASVYARFRFRQSRIFSCETLQLCSPYFTVMSAVGSYHQSRDHPAAAFSAASNRLAASSVVVFRMRSVFRHAYLEDKRQFPSSVFQSWRWSGRIKTDRFANAVFGHWDETGICGFEMRNYNFCGFSADGVKGLFLSKTAPSDRQLVVCESAIDCLSWFVLHETGTERFASLAGFPSQKQRDSLRFQIGRMPEGATIIAATDADEGGEKLATIIQSELLPFKSSSPFTGTNRRRRTGTLHWSSGVCWQRIRHRDVCSPPTQRSTCSRRRK
jgi:hypothetical protein